MVRNVICIFFIFILLNPINPQVTIFPDSMPSFDNALPSITGDTFIYAAGYFTTSSNSLYINKQAIILKPYDTPTYCSLPTSGSITSSSSDTTVSNNVSPGTSELNTIFQNTIKSTYIDGIYCKFPIYTSGNNLYSWTLRIPVYNSHSSASNLVLKSLDNSGSYNVDLFNTNYPSINSNSVYMLILTIAQTSTTGQVTITTPSGASNLVYLDTSSASFLNLYFYFGNANSDVVLSYFIITLKATNNFTRNGSTSCSASNPCLERYTCVGTTCKTCHASCLTCSQDSSSGVANTSCLTCQRHTSGWKSIPSSGSCDFEYVDVSQYSNISVTTIEPPRTNRVTLSFWTFVSNLTGFNSSTNVINFSLKNFLVMSIYGKTSTTIGLYCTVYQKLKTTVESQVSLSGLESQITSDTTTYIGQLIPAGSQPSVSMNGKWFYSQCAMSFDHEQFFVNTSVDGTDNYTFKSLPHETLFSSPTTVYNDFYFKSGYRSGDYLTLKILNASLAGSQIFIKNLYIFREFIPYNLKYMHFNIHKIITSTADWPELIYAAGFDSFKYGGSYYVDTYIYPTSASSTMVFTANGTPNLSPPVNFKRLELVSSLNLKFSSTDLSSTSSITAGSNQYMVFADNKALTCQNNYWLELSTFNCNSNCIGSYTMYPGISGSKGYCNYACTASMNCPNTGSQMSDLLDNFSCTSSTTSNVYYSCVTTSLPNYSNMYFNSFYNPSNIYIDTTLLTAYKSYIIEIWYLPDNTMSSNNFLSSSAPSNANYVFVSNSMSVFINSNNKLHYLEMTYNKSNPTSLSGIINSFEWNRLIFNVYYDGTNYNLQFYVGSPQNSNPITGSTSNNQSLSYILFCHLESGSCGGSTYYWASGLYRGLRIWNGDLAQPNSLSKYDDIYSSFAFAKRPISIYLYYPLSLGYIINNMFTDPGNSANNFSISTYSNPFKLQAFNYCTNLDYIQATNQSTKYMSNIVNQVVTVGSCHASCNRCFSSTSTTCYKCNSGYFLYGSECKSNSSGNYFFTSPSNESSPNDITFNTFGSNVTPKGTITFWAKIIGFVSPTSDMVYYSSNLKLAYDGTNFGSNSNYGLSLINSSSSTYLARESQFRFYFGKWTFFSVAYYYDSSTTGYFPAMLKFEINSNSYTILNSSINNLSIAQFTISKNSYGLFANIKAYSEYIIGAYGYETNTASLSAPFSKPSPYKTYLSTGSNTSNCLSRSSDTSGWTDSYTCSIDYDYVFDSTKLCSVQKTYFNPSSATCSTCPNNPVTSGTGCSIACMSNSVNSSNTFLTGCSCTISNSNSSMIFKNGNQNVCYRFDYINFAKVNTITLSSIPTAKSTSKYTMQFWIFAYSYVSNTFGGVTFSWNYHNKVDIISSGGSYLFKCYPLYDASDSSYENSLSSTLAFTMNAWNYISCSVDRNTKYFYMNTGSLSYNTNFGVSMPSSFDSATTTTLIISENTSSYSEWGVLFFRQIRLWMDCYTSAGFLSRINILTPSLFPDALGIWDPLYSGTNQMVDLTGKSSTVTLSYVSGIGANVVDNTVYSTLFLCSENGQYYDSTSSSCVQFTDLSNVNDFSISNIASSYTGEYTMEFWIFVEDYTDVTNGVNIIWGDHVTLSIIKTTSLTGYCFPQGYYDDLRSTTGNNINVKYGSALNAYSFTLASTSGQWIWVRCAVSNYNQIYYINTSGNQVLKAETLYESTSNDYPFRYYFPSTTPSTLYVQNISLQTKKIYMRNIYLFRDYLPITYMFKYMDLTKVSKDYFPSLVFASNFENYNFSTKQLKYNLYEYGYAATFDATVTVTVKVGSTFALAANFVQMPLCNPNSNMKYDISTNTCISITNCVKSSLNAWYCYDESAPLTCYPNNYYNMGGGTPTCTGQCPAGTIRTPGSVPANAICNTACDSKVVSCPYGSVGLLSDIKSNFACQTNYDRINYHCSAQANSSKSALFFSRCYNSPNVYLDLSPTTTGKLSAGHIFEFWFKIDNVFNKCSVGSKEYFLYSPPHTIYRDTSNNKFYYNVYDNTSYLGELPSIQKYEWNRIMIKVKTQDVWVFVNYGLTNAEYSKTSIPSTTSMKLATISFCSKSTNGNCRSSGSASIEWGSAYYRNIRVWDVSSATEWLVQSYNNNLFTETLKSLVLYYPLTVNKIDANVLTNTVGNYDHIDYSINYSASTNRLYSVDKGTLLNYSTTFDWGVSNPGLYIASMTGTTVTSGTCAAACSRCYSSAISSCYECNTGFVLKGQTCINVSNYYMKVPVTTAATPVSLKIINGSTYDMTKVTAFTMTFWIKFFGATSSSVSSNPYIISLSPNTMIAYDTSSNSLQFLQNSIKAFELTSWASYIGQWVLITFSNYISNSINTYYPNMMTMTVDKIDLPMQSTYSIPSSGVPITQVLLGYEIVALFAEFRFYSKFIQGAYGLVTSTTSSRSKNLIFSISLSGNSASNCISDTNLASGTVSALGITCVGDYNTYLDSQMQCNDDLKYLDVSLVATNPPCASCSLSCPTLCFNSAANQCTCDISQGYFWLRKDSSKLSYCDPVTNIDFSSYNNITFPQVKGSRTKESTIEFWAFIYSYNNSQYQFNQLDIVWNLHNKVTLYNQNNSLYSKCYVLFDNSNASRFSETISLTLTYYKWNLIRCGTDLRNNQFFYNTVLNEMQTTDIPSQPTTTTLTISTPNTSLTSFGFVFIRELKLWQQFNYKYIDTSYININFNNYPGLLHYFKNSYDSTVVNMQDTINASIFQLLTRKSDFIGYNFVDPNNAGLWSTLNLCSEGQVYNPTTLTCITPTSTKCLYPGNVNDDCITCAKSSIYIDPSTGNCVSTCPPKWFGNNNINQCRQCDSSCYQCTDIWPTSCTACTGNLYFVPATSQCVSTCEAFGLTQSLTTPNLCVLFDASAVLENVSPSVPINPTTFTSLTAKVIGATSNNYTTLWAFDSAASQVANNSTSLTFDSAGPFVSSMNNLNVTLNPSFFNLGLKYNFVLNIIKTNNNSSVTITKNWTLTMNQSPQSGMIKVTPNIGLRNTTTFIIDCINWSDDISKSLLYKFYSVENNTNTVNLISNWSSNTETYTKFTVRYYQLQTTSIVVSCDVMDSMGAVSTAKTTITIVNSLSSNYYNLTAALQSYSLQAGLDDSGLLARSEYLKSLGMDTLKEVQPKIKRTVFSPSLDNSIVTQTDPQCTSDFCNGNGYCDLVDMSIACNCELGYVGNNCHIDKNGYTNLVSQYQSLYNAININIENVITYNQLKSMWNLYSSASSFTQDPTFFSNDLNTFMTLAQNSFMASVINNTAMYFDFYDFYFSYTSMRMNQMLLKNKNSTNYPFRNVSLTLSQQQDFAASYADISKGLNNLISNIIKTLGMTSQTIVYSSSNLYIAIAQLTPVFNETQFFASRIADYKSWVKFMSCINYIEITRLNNPYYVAWFAFVEYQSFPFSYNPSIYTNNTSPLVELFFIDATTGKNIIVQGCDSTPITFFLPFSSYKWLSQLNSQKWLYDPDNYKSPDDPIFSSPIYINSTGFVSNDTIAERIKLYHRQYNFSCQYYDSTSQSFGMNGINYTNLTYNYVAFNSSHLTQFSTFFIQNDVEYVVDGRFFYLKNPQILLYSPNYWTNFAWYVILALLCFYFLSIFILTCYDYQFFRQESLLEFLKKEIVKVQSPYEQKVEFNVNDIIPADLQPSGDKPYEEYVKRKNKQNPEREDQMQEKENNKADILNLNNFGDTNQENQEFKIAFDDDDPVPNDNAKKFMFEPESLDIRDERMRRDDKIQSFDKDEKGGMNNFLNYADKNGDGKGTFVGNVDLLQNENKEAAADPFSTDENEEEEYEKRIEAFANLNLTSCQFLCWNIKQRHVLLAPLLNVSVFNPRYKKLTLFVTECAVMMLIISVQLTSDETTIVNFSKSPIVMQNFAKLFQYAIIAAFGTNFILYILAVFFRTSSYQRRRLYRIVTSGAQLLILKEWDEMSCTNLFFTIIGMMLNISLWLISFYVSLTFVSVWKDYAWTWLVGFLIAFVIDVIILEFLFEWIISLFYWRRRSSQCAVKFAEWLNRLRSYRTLWP